MIHSPSLALLASLILSVQNTCSAQVLSLTFLNTHLLIYICVADPSLLQLEDYLQGCEDTNLYRKGVKALALIYTSADPSHYRQPPVSLHLLHCTAGRVVAALCLPLSELLRSTLAISGKQITHKTCTLSRRVTNLAQHARVPVALSGRIRKKLRHPSQRSPVERQKQRQAPVD